MSSATHPPTESWWLAGLWVTVVIMLSIGLWRIWPDARVAETGLLSLLPDAELSAAERDMLARLADTTGNTMLWMLEADGSDVTDDHLGWLAEALRTSALFQSVGTDNQSALRGAAALQPWRYQLLAPALRETLAMADTPEAAAIAGKALVDKRLRQLFSPGGMAGATGIGEDPLGLFQGWLMSWAPLDVTLRQGAMVSADGGFILPGVLRASGFDLDTQFRLASLMTRLQTEAAGQGLKLRVGGIPAYAAHNAVSARNEVSLVGTGSTVGIIVLVLFAFRSLRPLVYSLLAIVSGIAAGAIVSLLVFGRVHTLTWVFGASLIGIAIDYAMHVLASSAGNPRWRPGAGVAHVFRPTALGLGSSALGFATLLVTPFPVLREIAVFAMAGLAMAWLTCMALAAPLLNRYQAGTRSPALALATRIAAARDRLTSARLTPLLIILLCLPGLVRLEPDDRITALQAADSPVAIDDTYIRERLPTRLAGQFFSVEAPDLSTLLDRERELIRHIEAAEPGVSVQALSRLIATPEEQHQALVRLQAALVASGEAERFFGVIGLGPDLARAEILRWQTATDRSLDPDTLTRNLPAPWSFTWQGCHQQICRSAVLLDHIEHRDALAAINLPGVRFVDQVALLSERFAMIRSEAVRMLAAAVLLVAVALAAIYGVRPALRITGVPCLGLLVAFAWLGWSGALYSVFNVFALLLVFGLGIDYAVFQHTSGDGPAGETARTELAILLSALTTLLAFGLLAVSETTVIAAFGSTLTAGITTCWLLSPLARQPVSRAAA